MVSIQKKVLSMSLRSVIQATDSTCSGCQPKSPATAALRQTAAGREPQDPEQQQRVGQVQQQIGEMEAAGIVAVKIPVQGQR